MTFDVVDVRSIYETGKKSLATLFLHPVSPCFLFKCHKLRLHENQNKECYRFKKLVFYYQYLFELTLINISGKTVGPDILYFLDMAKSEDVIR